MPNTVKLKPVAAHLKPLTHTLLDIFRLLQIDLDQFSSIQINGVTAYVMPANGLIVIHQRYCAPKTDACIH